MSTQPNSYIRFEKKSLEDHCGIVAAYAPQDMKFFNWGLNSLQLLQTRGYDGAGVWARSKAGETKSHKGVGMIAEVFKSAKKSNLADFAANTWLYQVRYGTYGAVHTDNVQPLIAAHTLCGEEFVVIHNGQFSPDEIDQVHLSDTVIFTQQLATAPGENWNARIIKTLEKKKGAWSLVVSTPVGLYLARDRYGFRPLTYGHVYDKSTNQYFWAVTSETSALEALGVKDFFELRPGTIAKITDSGLEIIHKEKTPTQAVCIFENIYIQHGAGKAHLPRKNARQINASPTVDEVRRKSGRVLAREAPLTKNEVDMVIGVPGTGIEGGMSFARALDLPYFQAITDRADVLSEQRTFMSAKIDTIYEKVLEHFNFDEQALSNRKVVLVDDSIVRGNITKGLVYLLKNYYKVRDVHLRILAPPIDKPCHLGVNTRSSSELIAATYGADVEKIRQALGAESLSYITIAGLKEAMTGDPKAKGFCTGCMAGQKYPIDVYGDPPGRQRKNIFIKKVTEVPKQYIRPALRT